MGTPGILRDCCDFVTFLFVVSAFCFVDFSLAICRQPLPALFCNISEAQIPLEYLKRVVNPPPTSPLAPKNAEKHHPLARAFQEPAVHP